MSSIGLTALLVGVIGFVPFPAYTLSEGVVWQPDEVRLRAEHDGFVEELKVENRSSVSSGTPLLSLYDPFVRSELKIALARVNELKSRYRASRANRDSETGSIKEELTVAESELTFIEKKATAMSVNAFKDGQLVLLDSDDLPGRFLRKGDMLGYVLDDEKPTVRMAVSQDYIGQLREQVVDVRIRFASDPGREFSAEIFRQAPEGTNRLPSAALATIGGGKFMVKPGSSNELVTGEKVFLVDLKPDFEGHDVLLGTRAYVRIDHGSEALATQWYRRLRQVFLRQFNV